MVHFTSRIVTVLLLVFLFSPAQAQVLFEGYSKIISGGVHIGYAVSRYEFDTKKKLFLVTSFLKTGKLGEDLTESVKAVADANLNPVSYEYTSIQGKQTKTIDAKVKKNRLTAIVKENGQQKTIQRDLPKGTFLSYFTVYVVLKSKTGLQTGTRFDYNAIAEEDADVVKGDLFVQKEDLVDGIKTFRILNRFKDVKFESQVTPRGEVLSTFAPGAALATQVVAKPPDAVGQFGLSTSLLKALYGDVPIGTDNVVSRALKAEALDGAKPPPGKQQGVPQGQNIIIKGQAPKKETEPAE